MSGAFSVKEFKPTIWFLLRFVAIYVVGSLLYAALITHYYPGVDPITQAVSEQCAVVLNVCGAGVETATRPQDPTDTIAHAHKGVISVYEGCNGVNVMIVLVAFLAAFGPASRKLVGFTLFGILVVYAANLVRLLVLYYVSLHYAEWIYPIHKYFFTAFIYVVVFLLWVWWVRKYSGNKNQNV